LKPKKTHFKPKPLFKQNLPRKKPIAATRGDDLKPNRHKCMDSFRPSDIFTNKSSDFWRQQNLKAWFKEQGSYEDSRYIKAYAVDL